MDNQTALLIQHLSKSFGALRAVDDVSITVQSGQVHALIGPNGAGKTTLFNCVSGFLAEDSGRVFLKGRDVTGWPTHRLVTAGLVRTFQITTIFVELTVLENVALAVRSRLGRNLDFVHRVGTLAEVQGEAEEILDVVGLLDERDLRGDQLAHGDKRVLEVAIGLALKPKVLLLDEPTAGMARGETERIAKLVREIAERTSILLVEHDTEIVLSISDRVTVMTQGRVIAEGSPADISRNELVRDAYLGAVASRTA